jgi:VWFA-related protein
VTVTAPGALAIRVKRVSQLALTAAFAIGAVPLLAAPPRPQAREPDNRVPVFPTAAEIVQIDVVVTGTDGKPVRDLRREDFEILEDGRPQAVSHFAVGTATRPAALPAPGKPVAETAQSVPTSPSRGATGRAIVLVLDDLHLGASGLSAAKLAGTRFLRDQVGPRDEVALVTTSGVRGVFQALTRDREAVARAIDRVTYQDRSARARFGPPYISEHQAEQIDRFGELSAGNEAFDLAVAQFCAEYRVTAEIAIPMVRERVRSILQEGAHYTRASLSALETALRGLAVRPGRKIVVLLSEGFFLGRGTWNESAYDLRRITDAATRSGAVVYSIDAGGLSLQPPGGDISERFLGARLSVEIRARVESGQDLARREGIRTVAEETGGFAVLNNNDVGSGLQRVLNDNEVYYLLAYAPASPRREGRFRSIRVRLPAHPEMVARTRKGYFEVRPDSPLKKEVAPSPRQATAEARERVREAFTSVAPPRGLPVHLVAGFIDLPDAGPTAVINVDVDAGFLRLRESEGRHHGTVEFVCLISNREGSAVEQFSERVQLDLRPETREALQHDGLSFQRRVALKPGLYQVRIAALGDGRDETGSASQWIEVPDLTARRLTLSSLFIAPALGEQDGASEEPKSLGRARARRSFRAGSEVDVLLFAYNAGLDDTGATDLAARFQLRAEGRLVHEFLPRPMRPADAASSARVPGGVRLSLANLAPGDYVLGVVVDDRRAGTTAERVASFSVE